MTDGSLTRGEELTRVREELFFDVPVGMYRTTPDGRIIDVNPALLAMLGYSTQEELSSLHASQVYEDPGVRSLWQSELRRRGVVHSFRYRVRRADGAVIWVRGHRPSGARRPGGGPPLRGDPGGHQRAEADRGGSVAAPLARSGGAPRG